MATHQYMTALLIAIVALIAIVTVTSGASATTNSNTKSAGVPTPNATPLAPPSSREEIRATVTSCNIERAVFGLDKAFVVCAINNPTDANAEITLVVSLESDNMPPVSTSAQLVVPAGPSQSKRVEVPKVDSGRSHNLRCLCNVR